MGSSDTEKTCWVEPDFFLSDDNSDTIIQKAETHQLSVKNPDRLFISLDHNIQDNSPSNMARYEKIRRFCEIKSLTLFEAGEGIGHQLLIDGGYIRPGGLVLASDSHATIYGALGCLGMAVTRTDAAAIWHSGGTWLKIPDTVLVKLTGQPGKNVHGKDIALYLAHFSDQGLFLNKAIEFCGDAVAHISLNDRLTIANMAPELGAVAALFPLDEKTTEWYRAALGISDEIREQAFQVIEDFSHSLEEGCYQQVIEIDCGHIPPMIATPGSPMNSRPAFEANENPVYINKAFIISCTESRFVDLSRAARILEGKKVHENVELYISAASHQEQLKAETAGIWQILLDAGALALPSGCGPCIGHGRGVLGKGDVAISSSNRNYSGRMGHPDSKTYLASVEQVAYSALKGKLSIVPEAPLTVQKQISGLEIRHFPDTESEDLVSGLPVSECPDVIEGGVIVCRFPKINTDMIFPSQYLDGRPLDRHVLATIAMENYDTGFRDLVRKGDVLVAGPMFGIGSSREEAATSLAAAGIQCIVAASFQSVFARNCTNNGLLCIEAPGFTDFLLSTISPRLLSVRSSSIVRINLSDKKIEYEGRLFSFEPKSSIENAVRHKGGLLNYLKEKNYV